MRAVVTGAAGFIGSHVCDRVLEQGYDVVGIDCYRAHHARDTKEQNLAIARQYRAFELRELDLSVDDPSDAVEGADVVFHMAGQSGRRLNSHLRFEDFVRDNLVATQRLLEAIASGTVRRFVFAGSSSVYGNAEMLPTKESAVPKPASPYGITKLAAENLVHMYGRDHGLPVTTLRYFTIYGPRQRPDMAIARFMQALADGDVIDVFGSGWQTRDFTYIDDAVEATVRAAGAGVAGMVLNIGGGSRVSINAALESLEAITGLQAPRRNLPATAGDQRHASASINEARRHLGWEPRVSLRAGLAMQWEWFRTRQSGSQRESVEVLGVPA